MDNQAYWCIRERASVCSVHEVLLLWWPLHSCSLPSVTWSSFNSLWKQGIKQCKQGVGRLHQWCYLRQNSSWRDDAQQGPPSLADHIASAQRVYTHCSVVKVREEQGLCTVFLLVLSPSKLVLCNTVLEILEQFDVAYWLLLFYAIFVS